jgi:hypothetical protein
MATLAFKGPLTLRKGACSNFQLSNMQSVPPIEVVGQTLTGSFNNDDGSVKKFRFSSTTLPAEMRAIEQAMIERGALLGAKQMALKPSMADGDSPHPLKPKPVSSNTNKYQSAFGMPASFLDAKGNDFTDRLIGNKQYDAAARCMKVSKAAEDCMGEYRPRGTATHCLVRRWTSKSRCTACRKRGAFAGRWCKWHPPASPRPTSSTNQAPNATRRWRRPWRRRRS